MILIILLLLLAFIETKNIQQITKTFLDGVQYAKLHPRINIPQTDTKHVHTKRSFDDLTSERMANAELWITRSLSVAAPTYAYANIVDFPIIFHYVQYAGNFGPGIIAEEYDLLVPGLSAIIGFAPVTFPYVGYDPSTTLWVGNNTLRVDYVILISTGYLGNNTYAFSNQEFRFREYIAYDINSPLINTGYTIQDVDADEMFDATAAAYTPELVCGLAFTACNVDACAFPNGTLYNCIADTEYPTIEACIAFLSALPTTQPCPYVQRSNTTTCRALHAFSSFFLPNVHCAHVRPNSAVCLESCLPNCSSCDPNAKCLDLATPPISFGPTYGCVCNNGYTGNGTHCTSLACSYGNCPAQYGSYSCATGQCICESSFTPNPAGISSNNYCNCPSPSQVFWVNDMPICLPQGRCINDTYRYMCSQPQSDIKCVPVANAFDPLGGCVCNYGFSGGWEYPCSCLSPDRTLWSASFDGFVCLNTTECTTNYPDCTYPQTCHIPSGELVGACY
jgi:hypothetical protein